MLRCAAVVSTPRALLLALCAPLATPSVALAQTVDAVARFTASPAAREADDERRMGDWVASLAGLSDYSRARIDRERERASSDELHREALTHYERSLSLRPDDAGVLAAVAHLRERTGDLAGALRDGARSLALDPDGPSAPSVHFALAVAHTWLNDHAAARDHYLASLRFPLDGSERATTLGNLGDSFMALGDVQTSIAAYEGAIALRPEWALGWLGLALARDRARLDPMPDATRAVRAASDESMRHASTPRTAAGFDPAALIDALSAPGVFYVPDYDRQYYEGIAHEAIARAWSPGNPFGVTPDAERAREHRAEATAAWQRYLDRAPTTDPWRQRAEAHLRALRTVRR